MSEQEEEESCPYGDQCYRRNPEHVEKFHPEKRRSTRQKRKRDEDEEEEEVEVETKKTKTSKGASPAKSKSAAAKSDTPLNWEMVDSISVGNPKDEPEGSALIASFDLDGTLIDTKSKKKFAKTRDDWRLFDPVVPQKLAELHAQGYKIVIFSNQAGIGKGNTTLGLIQHRVHLLLAECPNIPIQVLLATEEDAYRKPALGMWRHFTENMNGGVEVDLVKSFYCGDAAGRIAGWAAGRKKDFSCSDRKFAVNIGLGFKTPEELFLGDEPTDQFMWDGIDPRNLVKVAEQTHAAQTQAAKTYTRPKQELIVMVGRPGSGKSSFTKKFLEAKGYVRVNRDTLKTEAKCKAAVVSALEEGKSVVVDNTNPGPDKRAVFTKLAGKVRLRSDLKTDRNKQETCCLQICFCLDGIILFCFPPLFV
eukprot:c18987_g1_i5.p1 GENE.c18987_g1_i5~~c18987_g1_i5.p1  ORF type:complete len:432 (+),score=108.96 c18987_g1_i5:42-1298(+)